MPGLDVGQWTILSEQLDHDLYHHHHHLLFQYHQYPGVVLPPTVQMDQALAMSDAAEEAKS